MELKNDYGGIEHEKWAYWFIPGLWKLSTGCFLLSHFLLFSSCPLSFYCTLINFIAFSFSMPQTVSCAQYSAPQNQYVAEDQPRCPTRPPLSRSAVLPCPPSLGLASLCQCTWRMFRDVFRDVCSVTWAQIDIPERDRHVRTYVRTSRTVLRIR